MPLLRKRATSAAAELAGEIHHVSRNRAFTKVLLQAQKLHVYGSITFGAFEPKERSHLSWTCPRRISSEPRFCSTANLRTKILDFKVFYSSRIFISRGGIPRPTGSFPESLSQQNLSLEILGMETGRTARPRLHRDF